MKKLSSHEIPEQYHYYRSHSKVFMDYILRYAGRNIVPIEQNGHYGYVEHFFFGLFSIGHFEKSDVTLSRSILAAYGMKRGIILWSGWRNDTPYLEKENRAFYIRCGYFLSHFYHHASRSAFSLLDTAEYAKKWSPNTRSHRTKIRKEIASGNLIIDTVTSLDAFLEAYKKTPLPHKWKRYNIWRQKYLSNHPDAKIRIYTASLGGEVLAGAVYLDDFPTSTYLIAFQDHRAKTHHLGLALVDAWFEESYRLGYKYLDLDHMQDTLDPSSYAGYTKFKSEIADYELSFGEMWIGFYF